MLPLSEMHEYRTFLCAVRVLIAYSICQLYLLSMLYVGMQCTQTYWVSQMKKHGKQTLDALSIDIYIPLPQPCTHYCCVLITKSNAYCKKKLPNVKKTYHKVLPTGLILSIWYKLHR